MTTKHTKQHKKRFSIQCINNLTIRPPRQYNYIDTFRDHCGLMDVCSKEIKGLKVGQMRTLEDDGGYICKVRRLVDSKKESSND